jgi:dTMP kinase
VAAKRHFHPILMVRDDLKLGKFITIEGQDGAGKSTNLEVIRYFLEARGIELVCTREPGGTELGESLRELILNTSDSAMNDDAELLLMFAARAQHLSECIEPALAAGKWVLCDRFTDATYAYQGGGRKMAVAKIQMLEQLVQGKRRPDLTILLDLPVEIGAQRADERSVADRFEQQRADFKNRVRATYLQRAQAEPNRIHIVDAAAPMEQVAQAIKDTLADQFPSLHNAR